MAELAPPLPPNRTGGSPAYGSPVSGFSMRLTISTRAVFQTKQPVRRKPSVGPPSAVGLAQPITGPFLPFAQQRPQASPQPSVRTTQARGMTVPEVAVPAPQGRVGLRNNLAQAPSIGALRQRTQFILQFLKAFLAWPFLAATKVPAQKVESLRARIDDARLGRMQSQPRFPGPLAQPLQHPFGLFFRATQHDEVVRIAYHRLTPSCHFVVQRVEVEVCQNWTNDPSYTVDNFHFFRFPRGWCSRESNDER